MKKKVFQISFLLVVLLLCLTLSVGMLFTGPAQSSANEQLSDDPKLKTEEGTLNKAYLTELSNWVSDRFCLRQELISVDRFISAKIFNISGDPGVTLGSDGWLYYTDTLTDYTGLAPMSGRELFAAAKNLSLMAKYCEDNNRRFLFMVAPNKNSVYGEYMPNYGSFAEKTEGQRLLEKLQQLNVDTADLFAALAQQEEVLYFAHDSHWNSKGAALGADLINAGFGRNSAYYQADFSKTIPHSGDLYQMLYPAFCDAEQDYIYGGELAYSFTTSATRPDAILLNTQSDGSGTLLAYRDSFGNLLFPYLADSFASARFSRSGTYDLTYESEYVLVELVERNLRNLTKNLPVMPAPTALPVLPEDTSGIVQAAVSTRDELLQVRGELPFADADSAIYVVCEDASYEAFCLGDTGFGLYLDAACSPQYVLWYVDGTPTMYQLEIQ